MTTYYCGAGGNDGSNGLAWATRKLTLNGCENIPVAAGDTVYVAPGVYREMLTVDVSGGAGTPISYIGDVTGEHTDGVGGVVRVTGSDDDQACARTSVVTDGGAARSYRTFAGFAMDMPTSSTVINMKAGGTNLTIQDCYFAGGASDNIIAMYGSGGAHLVQRCVFINHYSYCSVYFQHSSTVADSASIVQNCIMLGGNSGVRTSRVGGITVKNCSYMFGSSNVGGLVSIATALAGGSTVTVNNNIMVSNRCGLYVTADGEITEDYNTFYNNYSDRLGGTPANWTGAHSLTYPPLFMPPIQLATIRYPGQFWELSSWSKIAAVTGSGEATDDLFGIARPATAAKNSWGAIQYRNMIRDTTTKKTGSASLCLSDAGIHQVFVPTTNVSTVFSAYCQRGTAYTGTLPQMIVRQPGVTAGTITDTGGSASWNQLLGTITPAASPPYVVVEFVSNNTAAAGTATIVNFDDFTVT